MEKILKVVHQGTVDSNTTAQPCRVGKRKQAGSEDKGGGCWGGVDSVKALKWNLYIH